LARSLLVVLPLVSLPVVLPLVSLLVPLAPHLGLLTQKMLLP